jgi:hypothetical protein
MPTTTTIIYNTTAIEHSQTAYAFVRNVNTLSGDMLFNFLAIGMFMVFLVVGMKYNDFLGSLMASSWIMFILSVGLSIAGLLTLMFPLGFLVLAGFSTMYHHHQSV